MAKITLKKQQIFADSLGATGNIAQFGSMKAAAKAYSKDPDTIQSLAAFESGWTGAVSSGPPSIEDLNGLFHLLTNQLSYIFQTSISEWIATSTYQIGSLVSDGIDTVYMSTTNENINHATSLEAYWTALVGRNTVVLSTKEDIPHNGTYKLSTTNNCKTRFLVINFAVNDTAHRMVSLPDSRQHIGRIITIKHHATSTYDLRIKTDLGTNAIDGSSSDFLIPLWGSASFFCGVTGGWYSI